MKRMLVADDVEMNKSIIHEIFAPHFEIIQTSSSELVFKFLMQYKNSISIILINENIAKSFNKDIVKTLTNLKIFENVPVILILNKNSARMKAINIDLPFSDVVSSPVNPFVIQKRVANLVELYSHKNELEDLVEKQTAKILSQNKALKLQQRKINTINNDMLDTLSTVIEYRDVESGRHIHRIKKFTEVMLRALAVKYPKYNMTEEKINLIASASSLHDIGKIAIPDSILLSPRRLTYDEFKIMKEHTVKGCDLLNQLDSVERNEYFTYCYDICRYHHEKYDGNGYPDGLVGDKIPIWAQVVSVADCYDALTSDRPYKAAFSHEQAVEMIRTGACGAFSDEMMDCFSSVLTDFKKLAAEYADINHADSSISKGNEKRVVTEDSEDESKDIYKKMDREDLIRTIENQKKEMVETRKKNSEILNKISDYVFEFDFKKDIAEERKGSFKTLFGYEPKNYSETIMLFGDIVADEYRNKFLRTFRLESLSKEYQTGNERTILECPMKIGGDIYTAIRCTAVLIVENDTPAKVFMSIQTLNNSSVTSGLDEIVTDRDPVTGLWNFNGLRNEISDFLSHTGKKGTHMLMLIDIDGFRSINRHTGYRFGNEILRDIAEVLRMQFNDSNIIGRVEDDNFIVFVKDCPDKNESLALVDNIFRKLHKSYTFNDKVYPELSACIGVADYPRYGKNFDDLFASASKAVDIAKINGKNMYLFYNENMRENWELSTYTADKELNNNVIDFERYFIPVNDSVSGGVVSYDIIETSSENDGTYDFDELYTSLYANTNITAVSLNSLRRIFSEIYSFEQENIRMPKFTVTTMFGGHDGDIVMKAIEEILSYYPINCNNICINLTQDMLDDMDIRQAAEFTDFLRSCGFEIGVYNVGMNSINTMVFTKHIFSRITFASSFLNDIAEGLIPVEILAYLMDCFTGLGTYTYLPINTDEETIKQIIKKADVPFGIHSADFMDVKTFKNSLTKKEEDYSEVLALETGDNSSLVITDKLYDEILEQTKSFIFEWIPRLDSVKFSGSFEKMYGYMPPVFEFIKNLRTSGLLHSDDVKKFLEKINFARSESADSECLVRIYNKKSDSFVWNRVHFVAVRNAAGVPAKIMAVCADVSEERTTLSEDEMRKDRTDYITSLYNKTAAENKIKSYLYDEGAVGSHAMIVVEICGYNKMEVEFGKPFANAVLKETANSVRELFRDSDIIGRINGAQFVIFVKGLSRREKLMEKAQNIISAVNNTYRNDKEELSITGKIGISIYPDDGQSYEELYNSALKALYFSKHSVSANSSFAIESNPPKLLN